GDSGEASLRRASDAWDSGDYEVAAEEYERYLTKNSGGAEALNARFQLANIYYLNLNRYELARLHYHAFLEEQPSHPNAYTARERLAEVLAELGRSYEAIAEFENLAPHDSTERRRIRLRIADLYVDQKNYNQALTEYEKVTEAGVYDEMAEQALQRVASIYHIARAQYQLALPIYERLVAETSNPETRRRALYGISDCYAGLYRFDEAIGILREIRDESEQAYIKSRVVDLEHQKRDAAQAKTAVQQP
ncbi:MAG TPA: tetratricopeptide repeat protein, partial [Blastocatellia bacterium]|nr:tetratricopeptide repeat protein [Blastocatellia bacterium]